MQVNGNRDRKKWLFTTLAMLLVFSLFGQWAWAAESTRIARVESVTGEVFVKKAGGTKEFKAYRNMTLNQGDHIRTGKNSGVVLVVLDQDDKITLGANTSMYLSELKSSAGGTSTKMNLWNGSAHVNSSKKKSGDQLQVETPTAVMGIRGTHVTVSQQPGETNVVVHSGIVTAQPSGEADQTEEMRIFPLMQAYITKIYDELEEVSSVVGTTSIIDFTSLKLDLIILQMIVENKSDIDAENEELLQLAESGAVPLPPDWDVQTEEDFELLSKDIQSLVHAMVHTALWNELITEEEAKKLAEISGIDLSVPVHMQLSEEQRRRQQELNELKQKKQQQMQQHEQRRQEVRRQNEEIVREIESRRQQQEEENRKAAEEAEKQVVERYLNSLTEEEREQFLQRQRQLNEDQNQNQGQEQQDAAPTPPPSPGGGDGGSPGPEPEPEPDSPLALVEAVLENRGDYTLDYLLGVAYDDAGLAGLTKENFRVRVNGEPFENFTVAAADDAGRYDVSLRFQENQVLQSLEFAVDYEGLTATRTFESVVVEAPKVFFDMPHPYRFDVNLANFSNILGAQVHVVYTASLVSNDHWTLKFDTVESVRQTLENRTFVFSENQNGELVVEEIYAFVLKPEQSAARNDIGSTPQTLFSLALEQPAGFDPARVALAKLVIVTETGEYVYLFPGHPDNGSNIVIEPSYYELYSQ